MFKIFEITVRIPEVEFQRQIDGDIKTILSEYGINPYFGFNYYKDYQVRYFHQGKAETAYFFENELEKLN